MNLSLLYGENANLNYYENRINALKTAFINGEGYEPTHLFSSPGRAEILGNHTDHNNGLVMVASISVDVIAWASKRTDNIVKVCSEGFDDVIVDLTSLEVNPNEYGNSNALVRGVAKAITDRNYKLNGFTAYTTSDIFKGAGVSSSAAFEVLITEIFNALYLNGAITPIERAIISQYAENTYFGKPCGLLDQSGISIGNLTKLDFNTPSKPDVNVLNAPDGYSIVITNTGGNHADLTTHYADIRKEMEEVASYFGKKVLRDVNYNEFLTHMPSLKRRFSGRAILRAMHYFNENERVLQAENALINGDTKKFLEYVNLSGISSINLLQNCYVPGETTQPILLAIEYSRQIIRDGAVRVHGGGFAGTIIAFVSDSEVDEYANKMQNLFGKGNVFKAGVRKVGTTQVK